jgi:hypothetical protein
MQDESGKAVETKRRVRENPPPRGRRKALAAEGQYGVEDSAFAKMIAAKRKTKEAPPPRGRGGRIKQIELEPYLAKETAGQSERAEAATRRHEVVAKMLDARRRVEAVPPPRGRRRGRIRILEPFHAADAMFGLDRSPPSLTGNRRTCYLLTGAGLTQNELQRTDRIDCTGARHWRSGLWPANR